MHFKEDNSSIFIRLRQIINSNVDNISIWSFIVSYPETARLLAHVDRELSLILSQLQGEELRFLEMIDGDSSYIMKWVNHPVRGILCEISLSNI